MNDSAAVPHTPNVPPSTISAPELSPRFGSAASSSPSRKWPLVVGATLAVVAVFGGGAALGAFHKWQNNTQIAPNVTIAGVTVGGLEMQQAKGRLKEKFGKAKFSLLVGDKSIPLSVKEVGGQAAIDSTLQRAYAIGRGGNALQNFFGVWGATSKGKTFMMPIKWNKSVLVARLEKLNRNLRVEPKNARLVIIGDQINVQSEAPGRELNVGATAKRIQGRLFFGQPSIHGEMRDLTPRIASADLEGQDVKIGEHTTRFNPGLIGRTENIRVSCAAIDGHVLMPGEKFSFNSQTGERTWAKGYRMAQIFERKPGAEKSEIVDGLAGGVCQTSSTLYNAVRDVNAKFYVNPIKILERNSHSLPVTYVPPGLDATVAWPSKDFQFQNVANYPIYVQTSQSRRRLTISLWARVPHGQSLEITS